MGGGGGGRVGIASRRRFVPKQMTTCDLPYQSFKEFEFILSLKAPRKNASENVVCLLQKIA